MSAVPGDPSPMEQKVLGIIGQVCVRGIAGGIDSGATEAANSKDVDGMHINKPCCETSIEVPDPAGLKQAFSFV